MRSQIVKDPLPYVAIFSAHVIWAVNSVVAKITIQEIPVMSLQFAKFSIAFLLLSPFLFSYFKKHTFHKKHLTLLLLTTLCMITINNALGYTGLLYTGAIESSLLGLFLPLTSIVIGWLFFKEKIFRINLVGMLIGFTGACIVLGLPFLLAGSIATSKLIGDILVLLSGIAVVLGFMFSKELVKTYPPLVIATLTFGIGAISFFLPSIVEYKIDPGWISKVGTGGIMGFLYIVFLATTVGYLLLVWAVKRANVSQANLFHYIEPAVTATVAIPLLGESISPSFLIGAVLVVAGVYFGTMGKSIHHVFHKGQQT